MQLLKEKSSTAVAGAFLISVLIAGCSSTVVRPIDEQSKDLSGAFDGGWVIMVEKSPAVQYGAGNWTYRCDGKAGELGSFSVKDGVASLNFQKKAHNTFVSEAGQFRFEVLMENKAKAGGTSDISIDRSQMTMIIAGSLQEQSGFLTWGVAEFANDGCTSKVNFTTA